MRAIQCESRVLKSKKSKQRQCKCRRCGGKKFSGFFTQESNLRMAPLLPKEERKSFLHARKMISLEHKKYDSCQLKPDLALVKEGLSIIGKDLREKGLEQKNWKEIEVVLAEGINNAIEHGKWGDSEATIQIRWEWDEETLHFRISNPGFYEPPISNPLLPNNPLSEGGRGEFLLHRLMDEVRRENQDGWHRLYLSKKIGALPIAKKQAQVQEMEEMISSMTEELAYSYENISTLFKFGEMLARFTSFEAFVCEALGRLVQLLKAERVTFHLAAQKNEETQLIQFCQKRKTNERPISAKKIFPTAQEALVFSEKKERTIEDCSQLATGDPLFDKNLMAFVCPVVSRDTVFGTLSVCAHKGESYFSTGQLSLARTLAELIGIARSNSLLQEQKQLQQKSMQEIEIASRIQNSLMPHQFPEKQGAQFFGACRSAREVGGDFFDVIPVGEDGVLLVIADVMGKGLPAALLSITFRTALHARAKLGFRPGLLLREINEQLFPDLDSLDMFITAQLVFLDLKNQLFRLANAGHCALLHKSGKNVREIQSEGTPLGIQEKEIYGEVIHPLEEGDKLLLLTDGLYEIFDSQKHMLGINGFMKLLEKFWPLPPQSFCKELLDYLEKSDMDQPADDDRTLIAFEFTPVSQEAELVT